MNKSQRQRIIVFVGHPIVEDIPSCEDLGKRLKKNNVAIDVINFANPDNIPKLQALVNATNNSDNSHFLDVPLGVARITDVLQTSPILVESGSGVGDAPSMNVDSGAGFVDRFAEYGGINPDLEPELAMAMKVSMEEERARQNQISKTT